MLVVGGVVHQEGWHRGVPAQHELEVTGAVRDLPAEESLERSGRCRWPAPRTWDRSGKRLGSAETGGRLARPPSPRCSSIK
jgi:hypothetical protein